MKKGIDILRSPSMIDWSGRDRLEILLAAERFVR